MVVQCRSFLLYCTLFYVSLYVRVCNELKCSVYSRPIHGVPKHKVQSQRCSIHVCCILNTVYTVYTVIIDFLPWTFNEIIPPPCLHVLECWDPWSRFNVHLIPVKLCRLLICKACKVTNVRVPHSKSFTSEINKFITTDNIFHAA